jgi:hypothetical protein
MGADVEQLDELARTMDTTSRRLTGCARSTAAAVGAVGWCGPDADEFRAWWLRTGAIQLDGAAYRLRQLGADLRRQAGQQRRTSDGESLGVAGGGAGRGGGRGRSSDPSLVNGAKGYQQFPRDQYGPWGPDGTGRPDLEDIDQGDLGDCWFLAGLGAITLSDPEFIKHQIRDNGDGTYTVTFYKRTGDGEFAPEQVTVDGDFPVDGDGNAVYDHPAGDETWAMIYEKAFAQWKGGYDDIEGGWGDQSMEAIYGREFDRLDPGDMSDQDLVWELNRRPVTVGTKNPAKIGDWVMPWDRDLVDEFDELHVVDSHVYTVKGTFERDGKTYVDLYNPWGWEHAQLTLDQFRDLFDEVDAEHIYIDPPPPGGWPTTPTTGGVLV